MRANAVPTIFDKQSNSSIETAEVNSNIQNNIRDDHSSISSIVQIQTSTIASITPNEIDDCFDGSDQTASSPALSTVATVNSQICSNTQCMECVMKDSLIEIKDDQIRKLRKTLLKTQKKIWNLQKMKEKLNTAFSELKKKSLIDEELSNALEVCNFSSPMNETVLISSVQIFGFYGFKKNSYIWFIFLIRNSKMMNCFACYTMV